MDILYKALQVSDAKVSPIEDRLYTVDESFRPHSVDHPLIRRWLTSIVPYQTSGIEKLDKATRLSFCKMCILFLLSKIKEKRSLVHKPPVWFSPTETIRKLNEFSEHMEGWFSLEESDSLIRQSVSCGQELLAAELVCRGVKVTFETCMSLLPFGSILYSLQELQGDKIYKTLPFEELQGEASSISTRDEFEFVEVFNEDFCEISTKTTSRSSRFVPEEEDPLRGKSDVCPDPLLLWKEMNSTSVIYEPIPVQEEPKRLVEEPMIQVVEDMSEKYTESFFATKLAERLEEVKDQECQYERWDVRSRWWVDRPDEFLISLQQNELSQYIPDLFSPSGTLLDRDYSLVRCSTRMDQAIQELNEKYDLSQHIEFEAIEKDDELNVEEELDLLLS